MSSRKIFLILLLIFFFCTPCWAFWIWTPETNKWVNPKYSVKDTPSEQLDVVHKAYNAKKFDEAIREAKKLLNHYPKAREAAEAQYYIGLSLQDQGKPYEAYKQYQLVVDTYPFSERSSDVVKRQYEMGIAILEGQKKDKTFWQSLSLKQQDVIDIFRAVIKNAPYSDLAAAAQYKIGLYMSENHMFQEARDEFEKVINDYPNSEWAKAARYQIAHSDAKRSTDAQYDQEVTKSAVEELKDVVTNFPDAEFSKDAKNQIKQLREKEAENSYVVAQFYEKQKNFKGARIYYQTVADNYQDTSWAVKALKSIQRISEEKK